MAGVRWGEFELIDRIHQLVDRPVEGVLLGIGDDAAAVRTDPAMITLAATDALVEDVHFRRKYTPADALGWKAMAINLSDIAAMGGRPKYGLVSMALPKDWSLEEVERLVRGMDECGKTHGCALVGGDTVLSKGGLYICVTVLGEVKEGSLVRRGGARAGDLLCVTGCLGGAAVGFEVLESQKEFDMYPRSVERFLRPAPRIREAASLVENIGVTSMIDISDGLSSEAGHICAKSGLGCIIDAEKLPVHHETILWAEQHGLSATELAVRSGEEYELLFTVSRKAWEEAETKQTEWDFPVTVIGEMTSAEEGMTIQYGDKKKLLLPNGWDHFKS